MIVTGGCLCGGVRYRYDGFVGPANYCHCADCRRTTGSAFNVGVRLERARFDLERGAPLSFTKRGDSGRELTRHFCGTCGSPLYTSSQAHADVIYVKAGTLDDPAIVEPTAEIWSSSAVTWAHIPEAISSFPRGRS